MTETHFVQLTIGTKTFETINVSTQACIFVSDFKESIKAKFSRKLKSYDAGEIRLLDADETSINPMDSITKLKEKKKPIIAVVEIEVTPVQFPAISMTRHQEYQQCKVIQSSRSSLTSLAVELDKIYPIPGHKSKGKRYVTIGDIFEEAYENNPEPKAKFRNLFKRLDDFYTTEEWNLLEALDNDINPHLHKGLPELLDGCKEVILPVDYGHFGPDFQRIAKKSNVVSDAKDLIVR